MAMLTASTIGIPALLTSALPVCYTVSSGSTGFKIGRNFASSICMAELNARCGAVRTLRRKRRQKTITTAPINGDMENPYFGSRGPELPPRDGGRGGSGGGSGGGGGGGGSGGGGGGGGFWGGFFLFGFLAFLAFLKKKEEEPDYHGHTSSGRKRY